jgi:hypothetical protein
MATKQKSKLQLSANPGVQPSTLKSEHTAASHGSCWSVRKRVWRISLTSCRRGVRVGTATVRCALRAEGIVRLEMARRVSSTAEKGRKRYDYTLTHERGRSLLQGRPVQRRMAWSPTSFSALRPSVACRHSTASASWSTLVATVERAHSSD